MYKLRQDECLIWISYIQSICGLELDASKQYLLESRLSELLEVERCSSFFELYSKAKNDVSKELERKIIDRITTHETSFFRDLQPFELIKNKVLPDCIDNLSRAGNGQQTIRIWSAACATGQEVYSLAILIKELLGEQSKIQIHIYGTDISPSVLAIASAGIYTALEIERGLPNGLLLKYFVQSGSGWKVSDSLRSMVSFREQNLLKNFDGIGKFHIILCRNVAIYFSPTNKKALIQRLIKSLEPQGALILGSTETIEGEGFSLEQKRYMRSCFFQLKSA